MPRKRRILKEHILDAALELMKEEGFTQFTARRIAENLNASTQPIYKEFKSMDDLKENLLEYVKEIIQRDVFKTSSKDTQLREVCANYIRFAKQEKKLFCALFMNKELPAQVLHDCALDALSRVMEQMEEMADMDETERQAFLDIIWPSIHGTAVLTAHGQFDLNDAEIDEKADHIVTHSLAIWKVTLAA